MADCKYQRRADVMFTTVSDEVLALDVQQGQCFGMNAVASEVWTLLAEPRTLDEVCISVSARFEVTPEQCRSEIGGLLEQMRDEKLIEVQPVS